MSFTTNGNMHRHARIHEKEGRVTSPSHQQQPDVMMSLDVKKPRGRGRVAQAPSVSFPTSTHVPNQPTKRKHAADVNENTQMTSQEPRAFDVKSLPFLSTSAATNRDAATPTSGASASESLQCPMCKQSFVCKYGLDAHFVSHKLDIPRCAFCQVEFSSPPHVYVHYFHAHFDRMRLPEFASKHKRVRVDDEDGDAVGFLDLDFASFSCEKFAHIAKVFCEKNRRRAVGLLNQFDCKKCSCTFPTADALQLHLDTHPGIVDVTCDKCDVTFATKLEYEEHLLVHASEQVVEACGKMADSDCDISDRISQPEFLLCVGLKTKTDTVSWCNATSIERNIQKLEQKKQQMRTKPAQAPSSVGRVQPIVIQPVSDVTNSTAASEKLKLPHQPVSISQPLTAQHALQQLFNSPAFLKKMAASRGAGALAPQQQQVLASAESDVSDRVKPFQCIICEFAFCSRRQCEEHCRLVTSCILCYSPACSPSHHQNHEPSTCYDVTTVCDVTVCSTVPA